MCQPEGTALYGQAQKKILDGVLLSASESRAMECKAKNACGKKTPLTTVALAVKMKSPEKLKWKCLEPLCSELGWKYKMGVKTRQ